MFSYQDDSIGYIPDTGILTEGAENPCQADAAYELSLIHISFQGLASGAGGHRQGYIGDRGREHGLVAGKLHLKNLPFSTAP